MALAQMNCVLDDTEKNRADAERMIRQAAREGARFVCLPEAFNTGYYCNAIADMARRAEGLDGPTVTRLRALAAELEVYIMAPIIEDIGDGKSRNTAVLIGDRGEIVGTHSKTHLVGDEAVYFQRGDQYQVFETRYGKVGMLICYDVCFPETARMLALKGAEIILVSIACRHLSFFRDWTIKVLMARALDNVVYVGATCMTGDELPESPFTGSSMVVSPIGEILQMAGEQEETIVYQEIDPMRVAREREVNTVLNDLHPEDYGIICKQK